MRLLGWRYFVCRRHVNNCDLEGRAWQTALFFPVLHSLPQLYGMLCDFDNLPPEWKHIFFPHWGQAWHVTCSASGMSADVYVQKVKSFLPGWTLAHLPAFYHEKTTPYIAVGPRMEKSAADSDHTCNLKPLLAEESLGQPNFSGPCWHVRKKWMFSEWTLGLGNLLPSIVTANLYTDPGIWRIIEEITVTRYRFQLILGAIIEKWLVYKKIKELSGRF